MLTAEESAHCARSHRSRIGDDVELIDGKGHRGAGVIKSITKNEVVVFISSLASDPLMPCERTWLCIAPTKQMERTEWLLEKAVEVGVGRITFFYSRYSERRILRLERLQRIIIEACKQCRASRIPLLETPISFVELMQTPSDTYSLAFAHYSKQKLRSLEVFATEALLPVKLVVGPEGGFADEEYDSAIRAGYEGVSIGERRLRTETAALVGCILIGQHCNC